MSTNLPQSTQPKAGTSQQAILVMGAGRSGTGTLTRALGALGIYLGRYFRRPQRKNPRGNYEEIHLLRLSKQVRNSVGMRSDSVRFIEDGAWDNPATRRLGRRMEAAIRQYFGDAPVWAFKYAGTGRLLPFWLDLLQRMEIEPAFVVAYRNPLSVALSRARLKGHRGHLAQYQFEWLINVVQHIDRLEGHRLVVVDYDRLLDDPGRELSRVAERLEIEVTPEISAEIERYADQFLRRDWRHTRFTDADLEADDTLHPLVRRAARLLSRMARDEENEDSPELWRQWREIQHDYRQEAPTLELIDELKTDNRRARWWDLSIPLRVVWNKLPLMRIR